MGSCAGAFYALDRASGEVLWRRETRRNGGHTFHGDAALAGDLVLAPSDGGPECPLFAFDRASGEVRWMRQVERGVSVDLLVGGGIVFAVTGRGHALGLDLADGAVEWRFDEAETGEWLRGRAVLVGDHLVYALPEGRVIALNAASGRPVWQRDLGVGLNPYLAAVGPDLYVGGVDGVLYRLGGETGAVEASRDLGARPFGALTPAGDCLLALGSPDVLACVEPSLDGERWRRTGTDAWSSDRPLVLADQVVVGDLSGRLVAFALGDGRELWSRRLDGVIRSLGSAGERLFVGTQAGAVHALPWPRGPGG